MENLEQTSQNAQQASREVVIFLQNMQNFQAQVAAFNPILQIQNQNLAQYAAQGQVASTITLLLAASTIPAIALFDMLSASVDRATQAIANLCSTYTTLTTKLGDLSALQGLTAELGKINLNMKDSVLVINQNVEGGSDWYSSIIEAIIALSNMNRGMSAWILTMITGALLFFKYKALIIANMAAMWAYIGIQKVLGGIMKIGTAIQWAMNIAMGANPVMLIVIGVAALIAAIILAWKKLDWFREGILSIWDTIVEFFTAIWEGIKKFGSAIGKFLGFDMSEEEKSRPRPNKKTRTLQKTTRTRRRERRRLLLQPPRRRRTQHANGRRSCGPTRGLRRTQHASRHLRRPTRGL